MCHIVINFVKKCIYLRIPLHDGISLRVRFSVALADCGQPIGYCISSAPMN